jgi:hypothetical protein
MLHCVISQRTADLTSFDDGGHGLAPPWSEEEEELEEEKEEKKMRKEEETRKKRRKEKRKKRRRKEKRRKKSFPKSGFFPFQAIKTALRQSSGQSNKYRLANGDSPSIGTIPIHVKKQRQNREGVHIFENAQSSDHTPRV